MFFFFFQAEDGIRDHCVTGVQTCALPIFADAVLIGSATLRSDDPQLTVRSCAGRNPVRVVLDTNRRLDANYRAFRDGAAPTLLFCATDKTAPAERLGDAEIVGSPRDGAALAPPPVIADPARRGRP